MYSMSWLANGNRATNNDPLKRDNWLLANDPCAVQGFGKFEGIQTLATGRNLFWIISSFLC